uniref:Alpha-conotoxin GVIIIB n=1 Tax=Conus geographus TaxID=6491 RepID=CSA8A_CONGE|nr:RecName: Full=Alpha-conotoxin GVIIIB; AltName: Full=AlphaS-conotoxin GVIIIB; Flags: Precursor [Conus geographus]BAO65639.1 G106_VD_Superfamily_S_precursor_conopeptide [Conus geographus]
MMSKMGAMFVLLLLFTLASSQQEGDVQARKTRPKSDFYRALPRSGSTCTCFTSTNCQGSCECLSPPGCYCSNNGIRQPGCSCTCPGTG